MEKIISCRQLTPYLLQSYDRILTGSSNSGSNGLAKIYNLLNIG
ncbi:hypothetical protein [Dysgonomonas sp. ZJ709]|nr:hypothetical protein [Dysgonomonas sp. ZJ709]